MTDLGYCYLHMSSARVKVMDLFEEMDETSSIGKVDEDDIEIPLDAMPPDPDEGDNLPSQIHPSFPYGNPFKDKTLLASSSTRHGMSTKALYEDAAYEGAGRKNKLRWKDLGMDMLLPPDPVKDEEAKARAARNSVHTSSRRVEPMDHPADDEEEDNEEGEEGDEDEDEGEGEDDDEEGEEFDDDEQPHLDSDQEA